MSFFEARNHNGKSRAFAIFVGLLVLVAFLLSIIALFAGTSTGFAPTGMLFQIDVSGLSVDAATDLHVRKHGGGMINDHDYGDNEFAKPGLLSKTIAGRRLPIHSTMPTPTASTAAVIGSAPTGAPTGNFYNIYLWTYCIGSHNQQVTDNGWRTRIFKYQVKWCSPKNIVFGYNTVSAVQQVLPNQISLPDFAVPGTLAAFIYVTYAVACILSGISVVGVGMWALSNRLIMEVFTFMVSTATAVFLLLSSTGSTYLMTLAVSNWNSISAQTGVLAYDGALFLALTWAATGIYLLVAVILGVRWHHRSKASKAGGSPKMTGPPTLSAASRVPVPARPANAPQGPISGGVSGGFRP